jgi:hypothetical protein
MKEKLAHMFDRKEPERPEAPPSYEQAQQGGAGGGPPPEKLQPAFLQDAPQGAPPPGGAYDPMNDPGVIKVAPQMVNIALARPEHLNAAYPQFQQREHERRKYGAPDPPRKHGAPLAPGHTAAGSKTGGGSFPGSSGATYNSAASRR